MTYTTTRKVEETRIYSTRLHDTRAIDTAIDTLRKLHIHVTLYMTLGARKEVVGISLVFGAIKAHQGHFSLKVINEIIIIIK
jgi:hypothetical protein